MKYCKTLDKLTHEDLIQVDENSIKLSKKGIDLANLVSENPIEYGLISNCIWDLECKEKLKTNLEISKITMNSLVELSYE